MPIYEFLFSEKSRRRRPVESLMRAFAGDGESLDSYNGTSIRS